MARRYPPRRWPSRVQPRCRPPSGRSGSSSAESIRFYGEHFWPGACAGTRLRARALDTAKSAPSRSCSPTLISGPSLPDYVGRLRASRERRPGETARRGWLSGCAPRLRAVPLLVSPVRAPGARLARCSRACRCRLGRRRVSPCDQPSSRRGSLHAPTSSTRSRVLSRSRSSSCSRRGLAFLVLHPRFGDRRRPWQSSSRASSVSPLLFIGAALLYVDQAARVEVE